MLTIAMPKGRIFEEAADLLRKAGYKLPPEFDESRKLILEVPAEKMRFILAKPMDVATYVEHGVADIGIAGKDVMLEEERDVYEVLDLNISECYLAVAGLPGAAAQVQWLLKWPRSIPELLPLISGSRENRLKLLSLTDRLSLRL